jgi:hypothetical protein
MPWALAKAGSANTASHPTCGSGGGMLLWKCSEQAQLALLMGTAVWL